jgi:hypothetical protein
VKVVHAVGVTIRAGPVGFLESRTARCPLWRSATSTQFDWPLLRVHLRQVALDSSGVLTTWLPCDACDKPQCRVTSGAPHERAAPDRQPQWAAGAGQGSDQAKSPVRRAVMKVLH